MFVRVSVVVLCVEVVCACARARMNESRKKKRKAENVNEGGEGQTMEDEWFHRPAILPFTFPFLNCRRQTVQIVTTALPS